MLLGKPREEKLQSAYVQAKNILHRMPGKPEFVEEDEAEDFAESLKNEIAKHGEHPPKDPSARTRTSAYWTKVQ